MDKLSDFFKELKDRASNPFISSFIISWLIFNHKVLISWIFYDNAALKLYHNTNHIDYTTKTVTNWSGWVFPLLGACLYTFAWPYAKAFIKQYQAKINSKSEDKILKITGMSYVSMSKHMEISRKLAEREKQFGEISGKEEEIQKRLDQQAKDIASFGTLNQELKNKLQKWEQYNNLEAINGEWIVTKMKDLVEQNKGAIKFASGAVYSVGVSIATRSKDPIANISSFFGNVERKEIIISFVSKKENIFPNNSFLTLQVNDDFKKLEGSDNYGSTYFLTRKTE